ncbi:MAG: DUF6607 family protein [Akkermansiaceae bacterium]
MKRTSTIITILACSFAQASPSKFTQDRAAILAMAGAFEVEFNFEETIALAKDYELKKPYQSKARELVKVAEDKGNRITLQHLLVFEDSEGDASVIKHWAQIWQYEDRKTLDYEGRNSWLPVSHSENDTKGTWTQFVTQVDDSPRYKEQGTWIHQGNTSIWTSRLGTRPLPRRDSSKRKDYDVIVTVNEHVITPNGWVHRQNNRKLVTRDGINQFLCVEKGLNKYKRVSDPDALVLFEPAEDLWTKRAPFWKEVREAWLEITDQSESPVRYAPRIGTKRLSAQMGTLSEKDGATRAEIDQLIEEYLR